MLKACMICTVLLSSDCTLTDVQIRRDHFSSNTINFLSSVLDPFMERSCSCEEVRNELPYSKVRTLQYLYGNESC